MTVTELAPPLDWENYDFAEPVEQMPEVLVGADTLLVQEQAAQKEPLLTAEQEVELAQRMELGIFAEEILAGGVVSHPQPEDAEERAMLEHIAEEGQKARQRMIEANRRLVISIAKRYYRPEEGMNYEDVVQNGYVGLARAVDGFDYMQGCKFSTYAMFGIKNAIFSGRAEQLRTIVIKERALDTLDGIMRVSAQMCQTLGREPSVVEIATEMGIKPKKVYEMLGYAPETGSLNVPIAPESTTKIIDTLYYETSVDPLEVVLAKQLPVLITQIAQKIIASKTSPRNVEIMAQRLGLHGNTPKSQETVATMFGLSRARIREIEKPIFEALRQDPDLIELRCA